ncbi:FadR/GntR family transcriptional regulator [Streptomyces sp. NPDC050743]|uniref:FadR/GntR family transcriptional regulator n=1 Tax=Streptomyces sp. NPDC050743 TaxID=3365634 RepID=UPI0037AB084F
MRRLLSRGARLALFAPLETQGRAEIVLRRLTDAIALGLLDDGEQLPAESELATQFGVSPVTVREALTIMRQQKLIMTRRGRGGGSFVCAVPDAPAAILRQYLEALTLAQLRDLTDRYAAIAGAAARLAALRAAEEDIQGLEEVVEELAEAPDAAARRRADGLFRIEVAAAAQSSWLTREELKLQTKVGALLWLADDGEAGQRVARDHRAITAAIADGDAGTARSLAEQHITQAMDRLRQLRLELARTIPTRPEHEARP